MHLFEFPTFKSQKQSVARRYSNKLAHTFTVIRDDRLRRKLGAKVVCFFGMRKKKREKMERIGEKWGKRERREGELHGTEGKGGGGEKRLTRKGKREEC